jgi:hypothetical protein
MSLIVVADDEVHDCTAADEFGNKFKGGFLDRNLLGGGRTVFSGFLIVFPSITSTLIGCGVKFDTDGQLVSNAALFILLIEVNDRGICRWFPDEFPVVLECLRLFDKPDVLGAFDVGSCSADIVELESLLIGVLCCAFSLCVRLIF